MRKEQFFPKIVLEHLDSHMQKDKVGPHFTSYTKINTKWITDLNVSAKIIKFLEQNISVNLCNLGWAIVS